MEPIKILVVEDDPIIGADLKDRLLEMEYNVYGPLASGEEALTFLNDSNSPDLIIMDIVLEGKLDGIDTARQIAMRKPTPLIFLTGNSDDATFNRAKELKPQAFLTKPFKGRDLKNSIELCIQKSSQQYGPSSLASPGENTFLLTDRLFIKVHDKLIRLFLKDILWVEADDYYCKIHTSNKEYLVSQTLKKFYDNIILLPMWMRIHRSFIVNLEHIEEIGDGHVIIQGNKIPMNKSSKEEILNKFMKV